MKELILFYHATATRKDLRRVLKEGLLPSKYYLDIKMKYPSVFLLSDPFRATMFGKFILEVTIPNRARLFKVKSPSTGPWEYVYRGYIGPEYLRFYSKSVPLRQAAEERIVNSI